MFKNRKLEIKLVKDDAATGETTVVESKISKEDISDITKDLVTKIVIGTCAIIGTTIVLGTLGTIAVTVTDNLTTKN